MGRQVKHWREARGFSQRQLAEEVNALGVGLTAPMVASMETERRDGISVAEVFAIAYVLGVPPLLLMLPLGREDEVEIVPGVAAHPDLARKWLVGEVAPFVVEGDLGGVELGDRSEFWHRARAALRLYDRYDRAQRAAERDGDEALAAFAEVLTDMAQAGVRAPAVRRSWADRMDALGVEHPPVRTFEEPED